MAKCEKQGQTGKWVTKDVMVKITDFEVDPLTYILTLTKDEAETLFLITSVIGGLPTGRRGDVDEIRAALLATGMRDDIACDAPIRHPDLEGQYAGIVFQGQRTPLRTYSTDVVKKTIPPMPCGMELKAYR